MLAVPGQAVNRAGTLQDLAILGKAMGDETRLTILRMLLDGEMCVCEIMARLPLSQPAVSHHLKILRQAGLVVDRRESRWIYYDLDRQGLARVQELWDELIMRPLAGRSVESARRPHPACLAEPGAGGGREKLRGER